MAIWEYQGKTQGGAPVSGVMEAPSQAELEKTLRSRRITATNIRKKPTEIKFKLPGVGGVGAIDISRFTRQFATMIGAGLPLVQCLQILAEQSENKVMGKAIEDVKDSVSSGSTLAAALSKHKKIWDELYVNMVEAGEIGGALDVILIRLAEYREKADQLVRKVKGAMTYPVVILVFCLILTWVMLTFIVPIFANMFAGLGAELPALTRYVLATSNFLQHSILQMIVGVIAIIVLFRMYRKTSSGELMTDRILLMSPILGTLVRKSSIARFSRTLSTLLASGVNLIEALNVTAKTAGNRVVHDAIKKSIIAISEGETITAPLKESGVFPSMVTQMISVGEKTGGLDEMLSKIADFYDEEVDAAVDNLTALIEPVVVVVIGGLVGTILISMYLPMFDIIGKIG